MVDVVPNSKGRMAFIAAGDTVNGSDCPLIVVPSMSHVARARKGPKPEGILGKSQLPSGLTDAVRLRMLTVQFSSSDWAWLCAVHAIPAHRRRSRARE